MSATKTIERMDERITTLIASFTPCLEAFDAARQFTGPSVYFYRKTVALRAKHTSAVSALSDNEFFDGLYATLTAWGMHRMGPSNAKLAELPEIKASFQRQAERIRRIEGEDISSVTEARLPTLIDELWAVMSGLRVGVGETRIVANSKALHLLLPSLMAPIDRQYTIKFFYNHKTLTRGDERTFREIYPYLRRIATSCADVIEQRVATGAAMDTCATKVIDNAIVGYVGRNLSKGQSDG